ncbi:hypothetical protein [Bifidobacterium choloepi]|uniref:Uncharacterized protein n=1 Tax=Bifidobacterium choloepi TaxID=2614131 RepID=A0A6I5NIR3_9BIFI|nr:hypothetical protein [Bifidobacterium choloepi]NEG70273.1 hypothetical protein [Bifidobacterium choloepi]
MNKKIMLEFFAFFAANVLLLVGIYTVPATSVWWLILWLILGIGSGIFYWVDRHALRSRIAAIISLTLYLLGWLGLAASMRHWVVIPDSVNEWLSSVLIVAGMIMAFTAQDGDVAEKSGNSNP